MVMIQIRNVPPDLHERLKGRADARGMNLSDFLKGELERMVSVPTNAEIFAAVEADREAGLLPQISAEEIVAAIREDRESH
jgi:plasmid stability protein